jgi:uncharacterized protein YukE
MLDTGLTHTSLFGTVSQGNDTQGQLSSSMSACVDILSDQVATINHVRQQLGEEEQHSAHVEQQLRFR